MPAQLANGGPPRRAFAASSSQDYEEGHFQQHTSGSGATGSGWQDGGLGDAFLGGDSAGKTTGASGSGLANGGLEKRGTRRPSVPTMPAANLPFNSFAPHRRPASPQAGSSAAGPLGSLVALASGIKNDLMSASSTGLVGNVKCTLEGLAPPRVAHCAQR